MQQYIPLLSSENTAIVVEQGSAINRDIFKGTVHTMHKVKRFQTHNCVLLAPTSRWHWSLQPNSICRTLSRWIGWRREHFNSLVSGTQTVRIGPNPMAIREPSTENERAVHGRPRWKPTLWHFQAFPFPTQT